MSHFQNKLYSQSNMKKNFLLIMLFILISVCLFNINFNKRTYFTVNGVKLAVGVDGVNQSNFPSMGEYNVNVDCIGVTGTWNYGNWELELSNMTSNSATCNISFTSAQNTHTKLNEHIIGLVGKTQGTGQVVNENGYRYEGKNPNNYVLFNGELWRIIGVFDSSSHGQSGNLTKIIRNDSIGSYAWDKNNSNSWDRSSLYKILNDYYYNKKNSLFEAECVSSVSVLSGNCDFESIGLNNNARNMVQQVRWSLGGYEDSDATVSTFYNAERSNTVYSGNASTTTGYVGLMYPSDYGYSVLSSSCARSTSLGSYNSASCGGQSWLLKNGNESCITPVSLYSDEVFAIHITAALRTISVDIGLEVRPTLYLKSSVYVMSGDGSEANPYVIGN